MICYASRTGTKRNLAALKAAGWRLLISRTGVWRTEGFAYALDNGRWTDSQEDPPRPFDADAQAEFIALVERFGRDADFVVVPDTVGDREETLALMGEWLPRLKGYQCKRLLIAVQDGMTFADVEAFVGPDVGIFMGGSTAWKLANMEAWGRWCAARGVYFHVGRVNSEKRIHLVMAAMANSFDGSSVSRYAMTLPGLDRAARQPDLYGASS